MGGGGGWSLMSCAIDEQCSAEERQFVRQVLIINVLRGWVATVCLIAYNQKYLVICGGNAGALAIHAGLVRSSKNIVNVFMSPIIGALSDRYGRRPAMAYGRLGWVLIWLWLPRVTTLRGWFVAEVLCTGILRGGDNASQQAALSDYFGMKPTLSAAIQARLGMFSQIGEFFGPVISDCWSWFFGRESTFLVSAFLSAATMGVIGVMKEPLKPTERRPFSLRRANPVSSILLPLRLGQGMRRLALSHFLKNLGNTLAADASAFRMGPMRWSPNNVSRFKQGISPTIGTMQGTMVARVVRKGGPKRSFELGTLVSALGFFGWSQVWRPAAHGGSAGFWSAAVLYTMVYVAFMSVFPTVSNLTMDTMLMKHGLKITALTSADGNPIGRGELTSAMEGQNLLTGILLPPVSGALFQFFLHPPAGTPAWLRWGGGGNYIVGGLLYLLASLNLWLLPTKRLLVDDE